MVTRQTPISVAVVIVVVGVGVGGSGGGGGVVVVVVVFTLNRYFYPTTSAVHPAAYVLMGHPLERDANLVLSEDCETKELKT